MDLRSLRLQARGGPLERPGSNLARRYTGPWA